MPRVMIKCPKTGKPVPTGMGADQKSFESGCFRDNSFGPCPECGQRHIWQKDDAFLEGDPNPR